MRVFTAFYAMVLSVYFDKRYNRANVKVEKDSFFPMTYFHFIFHRELF